jgi:hypothetical protein
MKFIEIQERRRDLVTVNTAHIVQMYTVHHEDETFTRVCLTAGNSYIDSPLIISQILHRINN